MSIDSSISLTRAEGYGITRVTPAFIDVESFTLTSSKADLDMGAAPRLTSGLSSSALISKQQSESCNEGRCVLRDSVIKVMLKTIKNTPTGLVVEIRTHWTVDAPSPRLAGQLHTYQAVFEHEGNGYRLTSIRLLSKS